MHDWDVFGWLAYTGLWIGGVILFADGALRMAPAIPTRLPKIKRLLENPYWAFAPLTCAFIATLILIGHELGWLTTAPKMEIISKHHFSNEIVVLDFHRFYDCTFEKVLFKYGGEEVFIAPNNTFVGLSDFEVTNPAANNVVTVLLSLGVLAKQSQASIKVVPGN